MSQILHSTTDFGLNLLRQHNLNESLVFSPLSLALALSLVHLAARGETRNEIRETIASGSTEEQYEQHFSNISTSLSANNEKIEIKIANHIFQRYHISGLVAVLINALYFKAKWRNPFYPQSTSKRTFYSSAASKREIDFMHARKVFRKYSENDQFEILTLPYQDETFTLSIFLPINIFDLTNLLKKLDSVTFQKLLSNSTNTFVNVAIPKFKIETESKLNEALMSLGIKTAFSNSADLGNMGNGIYVNEVFHKALIEVNESGTTAAATTNVNILVSGLRMSNRTKKPIEFIADHPFLFVLSKDNNPIFLGIYN
ncbi:hypothetical protein GCK72_018775 [Caenorhabditis remanei]|uniref:Serpin domain-containing protein n=1 Tax=Caenorhabditis remanei TaxID=31234 RepID=A0A6A5GBX7_CAERE|nr:hypothetical protein GCK72_018775 [Caenorhabditis remanei]KAF1752221.1 hypothetical protein GCK72_018775 [Caenorhabditis remanei]